MSLTSKEWDDITTELEPQVMPDYGKKKTAISVGAIWWVTNTYERLRHDN